MRTYKQDVPTHYLHTGAAGATLPLSQALITGILVGLTVLASMIYYRVSDGPFFALIAGLVVATGTWLFSIRHWFNLTVLENYTGLDIDNDGVVGDPESSEPVAVRPVRVDIEERDHQGRHVGTTRATFPNEWRMIQLAEHIIINKGTFSEPALCGKGKILTPKEYQEIKTEMLARGMLVARNPREPKQGYEVTRAGLAVMRDMLDRPPSPAG